MLLNNQDAVNSYLLSSDYLTGFCFVFRQVMNFMSKQLVAVVVRLFLSDSSTGYVFSYQRQCLLGL